MLDKVHIRTNEFSINPNILADSKIWNYKADSSGIEYYYPEKESFKGIDFKYIPSQTELRVGFNPYKSQIGVSGLNKDYIKASERKVAAEFSKRGIRANMADMSLSRIDICKDVQLNHKPVMYQNTVYSLPYSNRSVQNKYFSGYILGNGEHQIC